MLSIEKINVGAYGKRTKYQVVDISHEKTIIATLDSLEKAGCLLRFLKGSMLHPEEYKLAVKVMQEIDAEKEGDQDAEK